MRLILLSTLVGMLGLFGCQGPAGVDLARRCPPTEFRAVGAPLPPIWVQLTSDRRPLAQSGREDILGRTYYAENTLLEPIEAALIRVLARDLAASGVTSSAGVRDAEQPLVVEVDLVDGAASYEQGPEALLLVLPVSGLEARCSLRLRLRDRLGRKFLDARYQARAEGSASWLGGPGEAAIALLAEVLRDVVDQTLPQIHQAPAAFWARQSPER